MIRSSYAGSTAEPTAPVLIRAGDFRTRKGVEGYEVLLKCPSDSGGVNWKWSIDATFQRRNVLLVELWVTEAKWEEGTPWQALLDSIEVAGPPATLPASSEREAMPERGVAAVGISPRSTVTGPFASLPSGLKYLAEPAMLVLTADVDPDALEHYPRLLESVEQCLKDQMHGVPYQQAKLKIKADRKRLEEWLGQHPPEDEAQLRSLHFLLGVLRGVELYSKAFWRT